MSRSLQVSLGSLVAVLLIAAPVLFALHQQAQTRNFRVVKQGVLYRSGQMSLDGLKRVVHDHGIRTVVTLRDARVPGMDPPDLAEEEYCNKEEITYVRIPPRNWSAPDGPAPVEAGVLRFREVMSDPTNYPVLVHCTAGIHRTGAYCAIYRMEFEHWTNAEAIAEMKACGYTNLDDEWDILGYLEQYRPTWQAREEAPAAVRPKTKKRRSHTRPPGEKAAPGK
jgi:protein tyrosine/serine phosphatase